MGRAKTDTAAIAQEVAAVADQEVLDDLFGDSASSFLHRPFMWYILGLVRLTYSMHHLGQSRNT